MEVTMHAQRTPTWIREIVVINAVVYLAFGLGCSLFPIELARFVEIDLGSPSALADFRAIYGGLALSVGALFALGLRRSDWFLPTLFLVAASSGGLALGRLYSMLVSGMPNGLVLAFLGTELASFVWALLGYRALTSAAPAGRAGAAADALRSAS
jgi:hypothetical protein